MTEWMEQSVPFNLDLGDKRLWRIPLRLLVKQVWLNDSHASNVSREPPMLPLPKSYCGFLVRSMPLTEVEPPLMRAGPYLRYVRQQYRRCFIDLSMDFERYEAKFSPKSRSTLRRKINRVTEENGGEVDLRKYRTPESLAEFFDHAKRISQKTYQHRLFDAGLPDSSEFYANAVDLARHDRLRAFLLFHKGEPAAYLFCPVQRDALIYEFLGYDPQFMSLSVGTVLQWLALKDLFAEKRFSFFDFTEGESEHKRFFSTGQLLCGDVYFLRPSASVLGMLGAQITVDRLSKSIGNVLEKFGLKARAKQILRFGFGRK